MSDAPVERVLSGSRIEVPALAGQLDDRGTSDIRASWLVRLRWGTCAAELGMILAARRVLGLELPVATLLLLASVIAVTNVALTWRIRREPRLATMWLGWILAFDTVQLTAVLFLSGGTSNPFSVFYLVQITLAAVMLGSGWTWFIACLGVSGYGALFLLPPPASASTGHMIHSYAVHLQAMWVAFTLSAALTAYFVSRLTSRVAESQRELAAMREIAARHERLAALTSLAAGAAHQLGTPLATVAVAAGELERALDAVPTPLRQPLLDDVQLIRAELRRSREILDGMAGESGDAAGEMPAQFRAAEILDDVVGELGRADRTRVHVNDRAGNRMVYLPRRALARAISTLVRNALDAAPEPRIVTVDVDLGAHLRVRVRDQGQGMSPDVLARAGEPFFTTKAPGRGLGLGLFLARSLTDHLRGRLTLESSIAGTTATLEVPARVEYAQSA